MAADRRASRRAARRAACSTRGCGVDDDIRCGFSHVTPWNFVPCMALSLSSLGRDLVGLPSIRADDGRTDLWSRLAFVTLKNDRVFYVLVLLTILLCVASLLLRNRSPAPTAAFAPARPW